MSRVYVLVAAAGVVFSQSAGGQSLQQRVLASPNATVEFSFASRAGVCGDGATFIRDGFGGENRISENGNFSGGRRGEMDWPPCVEGPVRVVAVVSGGELIRLHTYAGPRRPLREAASRDLGVVPVADAADFLARTISEARGRPATEAIVPLILADSLDLWPRLFRFARDEQLSHTVRSSVDFWLARAATGKLGLADRDESDDDDVRASAVFALSQQPKDVAVPRLVDLVRTSTHPGVRAQALFWLGQSGDPRAVDLLEEILRTR
jgi:hypothetical protein